MEKTRNHRDPDPNGEQGTTGTLTLMGEKKEPQGPNPNGKQGTSLVHLEVRWTLRVLNT